MFDLLLKNAAVVTVDPKHNVYFPGYVAIKDGKIASVGPMESYPDEPSAKIIDCGGKAILPGLIDAHGHGGHSTLRYLGEGSGNWSYMAAEIYCRDTDDFFWYADSALTAAERIKFGVTTGVSMIGSMNRADRIEILDAHFAGARKTGIRHFSGLGCSGNAPKYYRHFFEDGSSKEYTVSRADAIKNTELALKEFQGAYPKQYCIVAPSVMGRKTGLSDAEAAEENRAMNRLAEEYGTIVHTHAYGGDVEFLWETSPEVLKPSLSLTHSTNLSEKEIEIVAKTGAYIFHGPSTNSIIRGWCPVYELLRAGANLAIVTDGAAPDRGYDLWRDMKAFRTVHRIHEKTVKVAPPGLILELCTIRPARALGIGDLVGSIEPGKLADLITIDIAQPHFAPLLKEHIVQALVYATTGTDVRDVYIEGEPVMLGRKLVKCSEQAILQDANDSLASMISRIGPDRMKLLLGREGLYDIWTECAIDDASAFSGIEFDLQQPK